MRLRRWLPALMLCCESCDRQILVGQDQASDAPMPAGDAAGGALITDAPLADAPSVDASTLDASSADARSPDVLPPDAISADAADLDGGSNPVDDSGLVPVVVPWSTGFEGAQGDSWIPGNLADCYVSGGATFQLVTTPV